MSRDLEYDDGQLQQLFAELEPKRRLQAIKGGLRREANRVRKIAINNLRSSVHSNKDLEKGVRSVVFKKQSGFRVTVGTKKAGKRSKKEYGFHTNRQGIKKPVLIWLEDGTKQRKTKSSGGKRADRKRTSHNTGRLRKYGFVAKTSEQVRSSVDANAKKMIFDNIYRVAKKYGCK